MEPIDNKKANDGIIDFDIDIDLTQNRTAPEDKVYDISINGVPIQVDACILFFANKRVKGYISKMKDASQQKTGSFRAFWADMIMLNVFTTRLLVQANPYVMEQILNPVKYFTPEKAKEFYSKEQAKVEAQSKKDIEKAEKAADEYYKEHQEELRHQNQFKRKGE